MGPLFIFLGLAVVGIGVAGWVSGLQRKEAAEAAERARTARENRTDETDPFADVPPENNPFSGAKTAAGSAAGGPLTSSEELLADKTWSKALEIGAHADKLADEAKAAKRVDNHELFNIKGKAAKEKYDEALELTAQFELDLEARLGETNGDVRSVRKQRNKWIDQLRVFHKTTSR